MPALCVSSLVTLCLFRHAAAATLEQWDSGCWSLCRGSCTPFIFYKPVVSLPHSTDSMAWHHFQQNRQWVHIASSSATLALLWHSLSGLPARIFILTITICWLLLFRMPGNAPLIDHDNCSTQTFWFLSDVSQLNIFFSEVLDRASNQLRWKNFVLETWDAVVVELAAADTDSFLVRRISTTKTKTLGQAIQKL